MKKKFLYYVEWWEGPQPYSNAGAMIHRAFAVETDDPSVAIVQILRGMPEPHGPIKSFQGPTGPVWTD